MSNFGIFLILALPILSSALSLPSGCQLLYNILGVAAKFRDPNPDINLDKLSIYSYVNDTDYSIHTAASDILASPDFDINDGFYMWFYGWRSNVNISDRGVVKALIESGERNVYALESAEYNTINYLESSAYLKYIGVKVAEVLVDLVEAGLDYNKIHLMGHSLGAHTASFTAKAFFEQTGKKIGRLTGMDPAGPCFSKLPETCRIAPSDATFVDIIHTNVGFLGMNINCGTVDYYVNGGTYQSGCNMNPMCNHRRAVEFFKESITNPEGFPAIKANDWDDFQNHRETREIRYMGLAAKPEGTDGTYHLRTTSKSLYSLGMRGTNRED